MSKSQEQSQEENMSATSAMTTKPITFHADEELECALNAWATKMRLNRSSALRMIVAEKVLPEASR